MKEGKGGKKKLLRISWANRMLPGGRSHPHTDDTDAQARAASVDISLSLFATTCKREALSLILGLSHLIAPASWAVSRPYLYTHIRTTYVSSRTTVQLHIETSGWGLDSVGQSQSSKQLLLLLITSAKFKQVRRSRRAGKVP